jgi:hypothetical protein
MAVCAVGALLALAAPAAAGTPTTPPPADPAAGAPVDTAPVESTTTTIAPAGEDTGVGPEVTVPLQSPPQIATPQPQSAALVAVPPGCPNPPTASAVFFGKLGKKDYRTAQFTVVGTVRAGTLTPYEVGDQVQVRYGDDVRFLDTGTTYIVGVTPDPQLDMLTSKVRIPAPLFGGDAVAGADDSDVSCPTVEDPVITLTEQATSVDTGLFTTLRGAKRDVLMAFVRPLLIAFAVLVGLVLVKQLAFATARSLRTATVTERTVVKAPRTRIRPRAPADRHAGRPQHGG